MSDHYEEEIQEDMIGETEELEVDDDVDEDLDEDEETDTGEFGDEDEDDESGDEMLKYMMQHNEDWAM